MTSGAPAPSPSEVLLSAPEVAAAVRQVATGMAEGVGERPLLVGVLKGASVFLADLVRALPVPCEVDFLSISPFGRGRVRIESDLSRDIEGRHVVLVEDIVDTGLTLSYLMRSLAARGPASLEVAALLDKRARRLVEVPLRWVGREVGDSFVLGYGMDFEGRYRNLPDVHVVADIAALAARPDMLERGVYRGMSGGSLDSWSR